MARVYVTIAPGKCFESVLDVCVINCDRVDSE